MSKYLCSLLLLFAGAFAQSCPSTLARSLATQATLANGNNNILKCYPGYQVATSTYTVSVTCSSGTWVLFGTSTPFSDCTPVPNYCPSTFTDAVISFTASPDYTVTATAKLTCDAGFVSTENGLGVSDITCTALGDATGVWKTISGASLSCTIINNYCPLTKMDTASNLLEITYGSGLSIATRNSAAQCGRGYQNPNSTGVNSATGSANIGFNTQVDVTCVYNGNSATRNSANGGKWVFTSTTTDAACIKINSYCRTNIPIPGEYSYQSVFYPQGSAQNLPSFAPLGRVNENTNGPEASAQCPKGFGVDPTVRASGIPSNSASDIECSPDTDTTGMWTYQGSLARCYPINDFCLNPDSTNNLVYHFDLVSDEITSFRISAPFARCDEGYRYNGAFGDTIYGERASVFCLPSDGSFIIPSGTNFQDYQYGYYHEDQSTGVLADCVLRDGFCPVGVFDQLRVIGSKNFTGQTPFASGKNTQVYDVAWGDCADGWSADGTQSADAPKLYCRGDSNRRSRGVWSLDSQISSPQSGSKFFCKRIDQFCPVAGASEKFYEFWPDHVTPNIPSLGWSPVFGGSTFVNPWSRSNYWDFISSLQFSNFYDLYDYPTDAFTWTFSNTRYVGADYYFDRSSWYSTSASSMSDAFTQNFVGALGGTINGFAAVMLFDSRPLLTTFIHGTRAARVCNDGYSTTPSTKTYSSPYSSFVQFVQCLPDASADDLSVGRTGQTGAWFVLPLASRTKTSSCQLAQYYCSYETVTGGSWDNTLSFALGSNHSFNCNPGYSSNTTNDVSAKSISITCNDPSPSSPGNWMNGELSAEPTCVKITNYCPTSITQSLSIASSGDYTVGATALLTCNPGYNLQGLQDGDNSYNVVCSIGNDNSGAPAVGPVQGVWKVNGTAAACLLSNNLCAASISNGQITSPSSTNLTADVTATFSCTAGYGVIEANYAESVAVRCEGYIDGSKTKGRWVVLATNQTIASQGCDVNLNYCPTIGAIFKSDQVTPVPEDDRLFSVSQVHQVVQCNPGYGLDASTSRFYQLTCSSGTNVAPNIGNWKTDAGSTSYNCQQILDYCNVFTYDDSTVTGALNAPIDSTAAISCNLGYRFSSSVTAATVRNNLGVSSGAGTYTFKDNLLKCFDNADTGSVGSNIDDGEWHSFSGTDVIGSSHINDICKPVDLCKDAYATNASAFTNALPFIGSSSGNLGSAGWFTVDSTGTLTCSNGYLPQASTAPTFWSSGGSNAVSGAFTVQCAIPSSWASTSCASQGGSAISACYAWNWVRPSQPTQALDANTCVKTNNYCSLTYVTTTVITSNGPVAVKVDSLENAYNITLKSPYTSPSTNSLATIQCKQGYQAATLASNGAVVTGTGSLFAALKTSEIATCNPDSTPDALAIPGFSNMAGDWQYNNAPFVCTKIPSYCPDPTVAFGNGKLQTTTRTVDTTTSYCCNPGYQLASNLNPLNASNAVQVNAKCIVPAGAPSTYATSAGAWVESSTSKSLSCSPIQSYCLSDPSNSVVSGSVDRTLGGSTTFACNAGFQFSNGASSASFNCSLPASPPTCGTSAGNWVPSISGLTGCALTPNFCPDPSLTSANGVVTGSSRRLGDSYTLTCNAGYSLDGSTTLAQKSASVTCLNTGAWSANLQCKKIANYCLDSSTAIQTYATVSVTNNTIGSFGAFTCKFGWTISGVINGPTTGIIECRADLGVTTQLAGRFEDQTCSSSCSTPVCKPQVDLCPLVGIPGAVVTAPDGNQGTTGTYACNTGFSLNGTTIGAPIASVTCVNAAGVGQWQDSKGAVTCIAIANFCPVTYSDPSGSLTAAQTFYQSQAAFTCAFGYQEVVNDYSVQSICVPNTAAPGLTGKWVQFVNQTIAPVCNKISGYCSAVSGTGYTGSVNAATLGTPATIQCSTGYIDQTGATSISATCSSLTASAGQWRSSSGPAVCTINPTFCPASVPSGTLTNGTRSYLSTRTLTCNTGYLGSGTITCGAAGSWLLGSQPAACNLNTGFCASLSTGTSLTSSGSFSSTSTLTCSAGFEVNGSPSVNIVCSATGSWVDSSNNVVTGCTPIANYCSATPTQATVASATLSIGSTGFFSCNAGYSLDATVSAANNVSVYCAPTGSTGAWFSTANSQPVNCLLITDLCAKDFTASTLSTGTAYTLSSLTNFTCTPGYQFNGASEGTLTCSPTGWVDASTNAFTDCAVNPNFCPATATIANGTIAVLGRSFGSTASITCDTGFVINGVSFATCDSTGSWSVASTCDLAPPATSPSPTPTPATTPTPAAPTPTPAPPTSNPPTTQPSTSNPPTTQPSTSSPPTSKPTVSTVDSSNMLVLCLALFFI